MAYELRHPLTNGLLRVSVADLPDSLDYASLISDLAFDSGWRLPNVDELEACFFASLNGIIDNFDKSDLYWSRSCELSASKAYSIHFINGVVYQQEFCVKNSVRLIQHVDEPEFNEPLMKVTIPITDLTIEVANRDFFRKMNFEEAEWECDYLGLGWRMPYLTELLEMYENLHLRGQGNFMNGDYLSLSMETPTQFWVVNFSTGEPRLVEVNQGGSYKATVRAVRGI